MRRRAIEPAEAVAREMAATIAVPTAYPVKISNIAGLRLRLAHLQELGESSVN